MNEEESYLIVENPNPMLVEFYGGDTCKPIVTVKPDGTVVIHEYGDDKEAAKIFWGSLEFYGKGLLQRISELEAENEKLKKQLKI